MIATLCGEITDLQLNSLVLRVGGVGYEVYCNPNLLTQLRTGTQLELFIYEQLREDTHDLYGFPDPETKLLFSQLVSISGVGPKLALAIISARALSELRNAIASGDHQILEAVPGVGKKTAARIVIELKHKVVGEVIKQGGRHADQDLALAALRQLGYSQRQAQAAIEKLPADLESDEERIRTALKLVSN